MDLSELPDRNPGLKKTCQSCGSPQPTDVAFQSKADEQLITDAQKLEQAKKGPDIHCGFCGARNPATLSSVPSAEAT
jgi:hypothetical protein